MDAIALSIIVHFPHRALVVATARSHQFAHLVRQLSPRCDGHVILAILLPMGSFPAGVHSTDSTIFLDGKRGKEFAMRVPHRTPFPDSPEAFHGRTGTEEKFGKISSPETVEEMVVREEDGAYAYVSR